MMEPLLTSQKTAVKIALHIGEPCRICGKKITESIIASVVYAGSSKDKKSRYAHGACWKKNTPQNQWAYPESE